MEHGAGGVVAAVYKLASGCGGQHRVHDYVPKIVAAYGFGYGFYCFRSGEQSDFHGIGTCGFHGGVDLVT